MKILILGAAGHGKDTVAALVEAQYGLDYSSSSMFVLREVIYPALKDKYNYKSERECFVDRVHHRQEWHDLICRYNTPDPTRLTRKLLAENDMYVGLRNRREYLYTCHLYDLVIWVDASERVGGEDDTLSINFDPSSMVRIDNNGSLVSVIEQIKRLPFKSVE